MGILGAILTWIVFGLIAGAIGRLLVPGRQPMTLLQTIGLGIVGSLAGGFIAWLFAGGSPLQSSGLIMSAIGAALVLSLAIYSRRRRSESIVS